MRSKYRQLRRYKTFATGLLLLMAVIYIACLKLLPQTVFTGYLAAFSEAAMVGALADWFAVTALFRHPMGIPVPHTNLIENSKKKIGENLGNFITENFLTPETIRPRLKDLNLLKNTSEWLMKPNNKQLVIKEIIIFIRSVINNIEAGDTRKIFNKGAGDIQEYIKFNQLAGSSIESLVKNGYEQQLITKAAQWLEEFILQNNDFIKQKVKEESSALIPGFVDKIIAKKITNAAIEFTRVVKSNPDHRIRESISAKLYALANDMKHTQEWEEKFKTWTKEFPGQKDLNDISDQIWIYIKTKFNQAAEDDNSSMYLLANKWVDNLIDDFINDDSKRIPAEKFVQLQIFKLILRHRQKISDLISQVVGTWKGRELSNKLELEVGKDLQFIRINGTVVGGLVGLVIHFLSSL